MKIGEQTICPKCKHFYHITRDTEQHGCPHCAEARETGKAAELAAPYGARPLSKIITDYMDATVEYIHFSANTDQYKLAGGNFQPDWEGVNAKQQRLYQVAVACEADAVKALDDIEARLKELEK